eukprot:3607559-Rhodomonas_salina.1
MCVRTCKAPFAIAPRQFGTEPVAAIGDRSHPSYPHAAPPANLLLTSDLKQHGDTVNVREKTTVAGWMKDL